MTPTDLPASINGCYLNFRRQTNGRWAMAYIDYSDGYALDGLCINNADTLREGVIRMNAAIIRFNRRNDTTRADDDNLVSGSV